MGLVEWFGIVSIWIVEGHLVDLFRCRQVYRWKVLSRLVGSWLPRSPFFSIYPLYLGGGDGDGTSKMT
jgi:hypothetical protein